VFWFTGSGDAVLRMATSACEGEATVDFDEAALFALFGSVVEDEATLAEFVMTVPGAVPAVTFSTKVKVVVPAAPTATDGFVQVCVPPEGAGHVHKPDGALAMETTVVFAGSVSVSVTLVAIAGPLFVTVIV